MSRRRQRDIVLVERDSSSPVWWLVVGGALGAGLALLFAPEPGSKTRRILARRLARLRSSAEDLLGEFREAAASEEEEEDEEAEGETGAEAADVLDDDDGEDADEETDENADDGADEDEDAVEGAPVHALSAREELEKRLVAARARRQRERTDEDEEPVA